MSGEPIEDWHMSDDCHEDGVEEQDFTDPDFVLGAVLAQLEELDPIIAWDVLADAQDTIFRRAVERAKEGRSAT